MEKKNIDLDNLNNKRVETTKLRVAHAIKLVEKYTWMTAEPKGIESGISRAVNLLEAAIEEMTWACEHFEWDSGVIDLMHEGVMQLGLALANLVYVEEDGQRTDDFDYEDVKCTIETACTKLSMALATLVNWFDDSVQVQDV